MERLSMKKIRLTETGASIASMELMTGQQLETLISGQLVSINIAMWERSSNVLNQNYDDVLNDIFLKERIDKINENESGRRSRINSIK